MGNAAPLVPFEGGEFTVPRYGTGLRAGRAQYT